MGISYAWFEEHKKRKRAKEREIVAMSRRRNEANGVDNDFSRIPNATSVMQLHHDHANKSPR